MKFTGTDQEIYGSFCENAKRDIVEARASIRQYFSNKSSKQLEEYKEIIFVEKDRQFSMDEFISNLWYSMFVPAAISVVITLHGLIVNDLKLEQTSKWTINTPLIITGIALVLIVFYHVWTHRPKSKKQVDETKVKKLLYFLENYSN